MMWSHIILNNVGWHAQKCHRFDKTVTDGRITTYNFSYLNIYPKIDKARSHVSTKRRFYFTLIFFLYFRINISQISTVSTTWTQIWAYCIKLYVTTCFQMRIWIIIFIVLGYVPGFFSLFYVPIVHLIRRWGGAGIYCKLIPDWIKLTPWRILFSNQYRTKLEILLGEVFQK